MEELQFRHCRASGPYCTRRKARAWHEVNAEIARIEQQVQYLRDSRSRAEQQLNSLRVQEGEQRDRQQSLEAARGDNTRALAEATEQLAVFTETLREAREALPVADEITARFQVLRSPRRRKSSRRRNL